MEIITNNSKHNHMGKIVQMSKDADMLIIVSAFISGNLSDIFERMPTIKHITIYTNLGGYSDGADKVLSLFNFFQYCKEKRIDLMVKSDDYLHGKAYLFYHMVKGMPPEPRGFVISSGNFTQNGLRNNHEYGVIIEDNNQQSNLAKMIQDLKTYEVTEKQIKILADKAKDYKNQIEKIPPIPSFDIDKYINLKPSKHINDKTKYFLKPIGTAEKPFKEGNLLKENDQIGFGDILNTVHRRDVFLCHATGPQMIVGYYMVNSDKQEEIINDKDDRWPYKFDVICKSIPFSKIWWEHGLKTKELGDEFIENNPGKHITKSGGDTLGTLQFGSERVELTEEFAQFIIDRIFEVSDIDD